MGEGWTDTCKKSGGMILQLSDQQKMTPEGIKKAGTFCTRYNRIINIFSTTMKSALVRIL